MISVVKTLALTVGHCQHFSFVLDCNVQALIGPIFLDKRPVLELSKYISTVARGGFILSHLCFICSQHSTTNSAHDTLNFFTVHV